MKAGNASACADKHPKPDKWEFHAIAKLVSRGAWDAEVNHISLHNKLRGVEISYKQQVALHRIVQHVDSLATQRWIHCEIGKQGAIVEVLRIYCFALNLAGRWRSCATFLMFEVRVDI